MHPIFIGLGDNDAFSLNFQGRWKKHIQSLIKSLQGNYHDMAVIFCNMPLIREFPPFTMLIKSIIGNLVEMLEDELVELMKKYDLVY